MDDRCFLGIKVPLLTGYHQVLKNLSYDLDVKLSITKPENYHFTLHFFGDLSKSEQEKVMDVLKDIEFGSFKLNLNGQGSIPPNNPKKTRVLYVDIDSEPNLMELVSLIHSKLISLGFSVPKRNYLPHLTVARIRHGKDIAKIQQLWLDYNFASIEIVVDEFQLIKSELFPQGAEYTILDRYNLL